MCLKCDSFFHQLCLRKVSYSPVLDFQHEWGASWADWVLLQAITQVIALKCLLTASLHNHSSAILPPDKREKKITASGKKPSKTPKVFVREKYRKRLLSSVRANRTQSMSLQWDSVDQKTSVTFGLCHGEERSYPSSQDCSARYPAQW